MLEWSDHLSHLVRIANIHHLGIEEDGVSNYARLSERIMSSRPRLRSYAL